MSKNRFYRIGKHQYIHETPASPDVSSYFQHLFANIMNRPYPTIFTFDADEVRVIRDQMTQDLRKH